MGIHSFDRKRLHSHDHGSFIFLIQEAIGGGKGRLKSEGNCYTVSNFLRSSRRMRYIVCEGRHCTVMTDLFPFLSYALGDSATARFDSFNLKNIIKETSILSLFLVFEEEHCEGWCAIPSVLVQEANAQS